MKEYILIFQLDLRKKKINNMFNLKEVNKKDENIKIIFYILRSSLY